MCGQHQLTQGKVGKKNQVIQLDVEPYALTIVSDSQLITRTLTLLLDNAIKFTDQDGTIGIEAGRVAERDAIRMVVWDTGIGIAEETVPYLFDPFTQVDQTLARRFEGVGLGLATVHKLVELLGGTVRVESELGKGSRFIVTLPAVAGTCRRPSKVWEDH